MKHSILLVDDDSGEDLQRYLELNKYFVIYYKDGRKAFDDIVNGLKYQLAIIDLSLPEVSGDEIILTSKIYNPKIPVISISGYNYEPMGSDKHIIKPFRTDNLTDIINSYFPDEALLNKNTKKV